MKIATVATSRAKSGRRTVSLRAALFVATLLVALTAGLLTFFPFSSQTQAAPVSPSSGVVLPMAAGNPGVPSNPETVFTEDFQNRRQGSNILLRDYTGANGERYTSSNYWSSRANCNGFIVDGYSSRLSDDCNYLGPTYPKNAFESLQRLLNAIGQINGMSDPKANAGVASYTEGNGNNNEIEFETRTPLSLAQSGRFITFSVDAAATSCTAPRATPPKLRFFILNSAGEQVPVSDSAINPCTDSRARTFGSGITAVKAGIFAADGSFLIKGETFGIRMRNETGTGEGNDGAFDNIKVLDATPQLDKSFKDARVPAGGTTTLTFTVTNTSELASKKGWSFTDNLPAGLVIANTPNIQTNCTNGSLTGAAGQGTINVKGDLNKGQVSCTFSVDVTSATPGPSDPSPKVYQNCPNVNVVNMVGVNAPNCAQVEFYTDRKLAITKTANKTEIRQGDSVTYTVTMRNTGTGDYTTANPAMFNDDLAKVLDDATLTTSGTGAPSARYLNPNATATAPVLNGSALQWNGPLKVGQSVEFTYTVTTNNKGDGNLPNQACATAKDQPAICAQVVLNLPRLTVQKSADKTVVNNDGDEVTYTVRLTNAGPGNFTGALPASVVDDLSQVLDDADLVTD